MILKSEILIDKNSFGYSQLKKYFGDCISISDYEVVVIKDISHIRSSGNFLIGEEFLRIVFHNYFGKERKNG